MGMASEAYEYQLELEREAYKKKIMELNQEIVRLKALLFHFTGEME